MTAVMTLPQYFLCVQVKRTAPVTGTLRRGEFDVVEFSRSLEGAGVAAIAVNTDRKFFGCSYEDLTSIRVSALLRVTRRDGIRPMNCDGRMCPWTMSGPLNDILEAIL